MRTHKRSSSLVAGGLLIGALAAGCGGDDTSCGDGTVDNDGTCVADPAVTCGEGTSLVDGECVIEQSPAGTAPDLVTLATTTPYPGGGFLELQGHGFNAPDGGDLVVTIGGDPVDVYFVSDSRVVVQLPPAAAKSVDVAISNDNGEDQLPFEYLGLLASDGRCEYGSLHLIDPRNGTAAELGPIERDPGNGDPVVQYSVSGLAFGPNGTLYGVSTCENNFLLAIDPDTGAAAEIGRLVDQDEDDHNNVPDIGFLGDELYGWSENSDNLIKIDIATGAVTYFDTEPGSYGSGIEAYDATQLIAVIDGDAESPYLVSTTGEATALEVSLTGSLDDAVCALTKDSQGYLGLYGDQNNGLIRLNFETGDVTFLGLTAPRADGLVVPPDLQEKVQAMAHTTIAIRPEWDAMLPASSRNATDIAVPQPAKPALAATAVLGKTSTKRGDQIALQAYLTRTGHAVAGNAKSVTVSANRDAAIELSAQDVRAGRYALRANQKGRVKLVDAQTGKTLARDVVAITTR